MHTQTLLRLTTSCFVFALVSGCMSTPSIPTELLAPPEEQKPKQASGPISVEALLARARGQESDNQTTQRSLSLSFDNNTDTLSEQHNNELNRFANGLDPQSLSVQCAPAAIPDPLLAASTAINRCLNVSQFLERRAHSTDIRLSPDLKPDQVTVSADN